jgi:TRAP-type transport system periplasmic protein
MTRFLARLALAIAAALVAFSPRGARAEVVRIGTLAPAASPWGQVYKVWAEAVSRKSGGRLELQFFYNGQQGDEAAMVAKMKSGQLDGAALTSVGLGKIYKPILALQIPGLFRSWAKLDAARDALSPELKKGLADAGFTLAGWGDVGALHGMSKGFAVRTPDDLRGKRPLTWRDEEIGPTVFQVIGGVTPVPLSAPEVLPALNTGTINVLSAPALAAEQLQWAPRLDHISEEAVVFAIGALVFASKRLDALPEDLRGILQETGKVASGALAARIRGEDAAAFARLRARMTVVTLTEEERNKWAGVFREAVKRLAQGVFPADFVAKLVKFAG